MVEIRELFIFIINCLIVKEPIFENEVVKDFHWYKINWHLGRVLNKRGWSDWTKND